MVVDRIHREVLLWNDAKLGLYKRETYERKLEMWNIKNAKWWVFEQLQQPRGDSVFFFINILNIILHSKKYLEMLIIPSEDHLSFLLSFFSARCKSTADHRLLEVSFILQTLCI